MNPQKTSDARHLYQDELDEIKKANWKRLAEIEKDIKSDITIYMERMLKPDANKVDLRNQLVQASDVTHAIKKRRKHLNP